MRGRERPQGADGDRPPIDDDGRAGIETTTASPDVVASRLPTVPTSDRLDEFERIANAPHTTDDRATNDDTASAVQVIGLARQDQ